MMNSKVEIIVPEGVERDRADKVLAMHFEDLSRTRIQEAFKSGNVTHDGKVIQKRHSVSEGDILSIILPEKKEISVGPVDLPVKVIFEDDDIVVIDKASGMIAHPGAGTGDDTVVHAMLHHCKGKLSSEGGKLRPGIVHRLDKETSGLMLLAKSDKAYFRLVEMFSSREVNKQYLALVSRRPQIQSGSIKTAIGRHPRHRTKMQVSPKGRHAHTDWTVEETFAEQAALLRCQIHTGRTHQIRVHLASENHPVLGDATYGSMRNHKLPVPGRILLHAAELTIEHPVLGGELRFTAALPPDFTSYLSVLREQFVDI